MSVLVDDRKPKQDNNNSPKKFEDYTYTYSGPDVQPQMQMRSMHPSLSTGYDQALGHHQGFNKCCQPTS